MKYFVYFFKFFIFLFIFILFLFFSANSYANDINSNLSNSFLRLHILANSNSKEDQNLKYLVRNNIINYMNSLSVDLSSKEEALKIAKLHLNDFKNIAQNTVYMNGYNYPVSVSIGNFYFPTKKYGNISLPSGNYDALKISIGSASGNNWWCVMFPPLCFVNSTTGIIEDENMDLIQSNLSDEEFSIINNETNSNTILFKFKIVELLENANHFLNK